MIIAIDGPAGSGKSTVARAIAEEMRITYIDTGAMYRAVALQVLRRKIDLEDGISLKAMLRETDIDFVDGKIYLDGEYVEQEIRGTQVTQKVSSVSAIASVREAMVDKQREIAARRDCVLDGRDIGTVVFPRADVKIFLTADVAVRAKRRMQENLDKGIEADYEEIKRSMKQRDLADSTREHSPLKKAEDAVEIDTSDKTVAEICRAIIQIIQERQG